MIILDTNVISEIISKKPDTNVVAWLNSINSSKLFTSWINIAEIERGISRLPDGKRKDKFETNFNHFVNKALSGRLLAFDEGAANFYGDVCFSREKSGLHVDAVDLMIVAIAKSYKFKIATRNTNDFSNCGIELINPWLT